MRTAPRVCRLVSVLAGPNPHGHNGPVSDRDTPSSEWPSGRLERVRPIREGQPPPRPVEGPEPYEPSAQGKPVHRILGSALLQLRRRWRLAMFAGALVFAPVLAYAILAVPQYTAAGVLQVSSQGGMMNPLAELAGAGGNSEVETEVEIISRRDFVQRVLEDLRLNLVDPDQPLWVTTDLDVALRGRSPLDERLRRVRGAVATVDVAPEVFGSVEVRLEGLSADRIAAQIGDPEDPSTLVDYEVSLGESIEDPRLHISFASMPVDEGETFVLEALGDGRLMTLAMPHLRVRSMGTSRKATNLVSVKFTHPDRATAQAVVNGLMQQYLDQSLEWQKVSASSAAEFIDQRLVEAQTQLEKEEETLRQFSEKEHAVQLDTQAQVTIEQAAAIEAEKLQVELKQRVVGQMLSATRRDGGKAPANLTANLLDDPVLGANVAALTKAETEFAVSKATLTENHPQVERLRAEIELRRSEVSKLLKSAGRSLSARRTELETKLEEATGSLSDYPDKELQLARLVRDVEVSQRLNGFLLEKFQEAQILEASTTIDKRVVDAASLPHRRSAPERTKLAVVAFMGASLFAFGVVYVAYLLKRRVDTVEEAKQVLPFPVYGTVPALPNVKADRIQPHAVWEDAHGPLAEAFRAVAVNLSLSPAPSGRGRIVQITSSESGEGKSTVISNVAVALAKAGASVLLVDLDLRKPVQHRNFSARRSPGFSELVANGRGPAGAKEVIRPMEGLGVDLLPAGRRLPDTLGALMSDPLERMLVYWSERYDFVLLDSPPAFVPDTAMVARHADLLLVVARPGALNRGQARSAAEALERVSVHKGLILNRVERKHADYYYGGNYYYAQTYGSSPSSDDGEKQAS